MAIDPATATAIVSVAAPTVKDALSKAAASAEGIVNKVFDWIQCEIIDGPTLCRKKKARELYAVTMDQLLEEAQAAAQGGDVITAYAIAKAAADLQNEPGVGADLDALTVAQWDAIAENLADAYSGPAGASFNRGDRPTHSVGMAGFPWVPVALTVGALVFLGGGALFGRKRSGNGGA